MEQQLADVEQENLELQQLQIKEMGNSVKPNYELPRDSQGLIAARDRFLNQLKLGKQSQAGKALDTFIKE